MGAADITREQSNPPRRSIRLLPLGLAIAVAIAGCTLLVLYARGGGPVPDALGFLRPKSFDPLASSGAAETALRTLRLAGFDQAVVGEQDGTVVVRVAIPVVHDARTVELSWQTALTAGAKAYPDSREVVAQLFAPDDTPLLEVTANGDTVRAAASRDDAAAVREAARFRYLSAAGGSL